MNSLSNNNKTNFYQHNSFNNIHSDTSQETLEVKRPQPALEQKTKPEKIVIMTTSGDFNAQFLNKLEAQPLILENDDYMNGLSDFDCQLRLKERKTGEWKKTYSDYYFNQILDWKPQEIESLNQMIEKIKPKLAKYKITLPKTIYFVKTTGKEELEGTHGYCRKNTIVLTKPHCVSEELLIHELFHIHSQVDPTNRGRLYELIGFHTCSPLKLPNSLAEKRVINPDSPLLNAYIKVNYKGKKLKAIPFDVYDSTRIKPSGGSTFLPHVFHQFIVVEKSSKGMVYSKDLQGQPIVFDFNKCSGFNEQIGKNTHYTDSPEEVMAENFQMMISNTPVESPELIEKMKKIFVKNIPVFKKNPQLVKTTLPKENSIQEPSKGEQDPAVKIDGENKIQFSKPVVKPSVKIKISLCRKILNAITKAFTWLKNFFKR